MSTASTHPRPAPDSRPDAVVQMFGRSPERTPVVYVHEGTLEALLNHAEGGLYREVGGFLLGGVYRRDPVQDRGLFVEVEHFIPAEETRSGGASLTFTHDTWAALSRESARRFPNNLLLGWYHTHPNLGVFLSGYDLFIQQNFFPQFWQIALVVDPRRKVFSFFQWQDSAMVDSGFVLVRTSTPHSSDVAADG